MLSVSNLCFYFRYEFGYRYNYKFMPIYYKTVYFYNNGYMCLLKLSLGDYHSNDFYQCFDSDQTINKK